MELREGVHVVSEALLTLIQRFVLDTASGIQDGEVGEADAAFVCCCRDRMGHGGHVVVALTAGAVMQVMKLTDRRIAGFQHFHIGIGGDGLNVVRRQMLQEGIHRFPPGPETVFTRGL